MNYIIYISINTYVILFIFDNYRILFRGQEFDSLGRLLSQIPKLFFLDYLLKIPSLEPLLYFNDRGLKVLIYQSLVIIFLTREYYNLHLNWLEKVMALGVEFIYSLVEPSLGKLERQKKAKEKIKIVKENKLETLNLSYSNLGHIPQEIFKLTDLKRLNLNHNKIRKIPQEIINLKNLKSLCLNDNRISVIPDFIVDTHRPKGSGDSQLLAFSF